jgi:hypothetical protein
MELLELQKIKMVKGELPFQKIRNIMIVMIGQILDHTKMLHIEMLKQIMEKQEDFLVTYMMHSRVMMKM